jgi:cobalt-precorrin-5B (C1)-methyltransferase
VAGEGVGRVTKPGLPIPPGEPAINPRPRDMMRQVVADPAERLGGPEDVEIEIAVPGGAVLAEQTWNPRLGIVGGISILGTTGIVIPYSCSAWIHSIHRGIDVARATGVEHVAGATGKVSEAAVKAHYGLDDGALIDMGDFAGGMLKYLRQHPVKRVTVAGGFAKLAKLADGHLDLHSGRSQVDVAALAEGLEKLGASAQIVARAKAAHMAGEVLEIAIEADLPLADLVARRARQTALATLAGGIDLDVLVVDRSGAIIGRAGG